MNWSPSMRSSEAELERGHAPEGSGLLELRAWIRTNLGMSYQDHELNVLKARLDRVCLDAGLPSLAALWSTILGGRRDVYLMVAAAASTNHTAFYRESTSFDFLRRTILPQFSQEPVLRVWSAAAATGQEAYSIAMVLAEHYGVGELSRRCAILGTDISAPAVAHAGRGCYSELQGIPDRERELFVNSSSGTARIHQRLQDICMFRRLNLISRPWPFRNRFHVTFCRNVLYYFQKNDQAQLLRDIHDNTVPGGWLITSVTESIRGLDVPWRSQAPGLHRMEP